MDDLKVVGAREAAGELEVDVDRAAEVQRPGGALEHGLQGLALEVSHHQEGRAVVGLALVEDLDDVLVREPAGGGGLTSKSLAQAGVGGQLAAKDLDCDRAFGGDVPRAVHRGHSARADDAIDLVFSRDEHAHVWIGRDLEGGAVHKAVGRVGGIAKMASRADLHRLQSPVGWTTTVTPRPHKKTGTTAQ